MDIEDITKQVQANCELSDAKHWGSYTICGLLLRLTDLYRWTEGIEHGVKIDNSELMDWIGEKEKRWKKIRGKKYKKIKIDGRNFDPFDLAGINELLEPEGFIYGAGYVAAMKPSFFLAEKRESRMEDGHKIFVLGRELARDLITSPALLQGESIFVRTMPARSFFWHKIEEYKFTGKDVLKRAFSHYGIDLDNLKDVRDVDRVIEGEIESFIHHEIGEAKDMIFPEEKWEEIVSAFPSTHTEKFARAVKDVLADTNEHGTLKFIIDNKKRGSLAFYAAFIDGFRKMIFPEVALAFESFEGDWGIIDTARQSGNKRARGYAKRLIELYENGSSNEKIEEELIRPFGI